MSQFWVIKSKINFSFAGYLLPLLGSLSIQHGGKMSHKYLKLKVLSLVPGSPVRRNPKSLSTVPVPQEGDFYRGSMELVKSSGKRSV